MELSRVETSTFKPQQTMWRIFILLLPCFSLHATGDSLRYLTNRDTVYLSIGPGGEKIFEHKLAKGQTIFSLAKFYGMSMDLLKFYNPGLNLDAVPLGKKIKVSIPNQAIIRYRQKGFNPRQYAPVYYRVKAGDNLFRLGKVYFRMPEDTIKARARLKDGALQPGQLVHIGWMSPFPIPSDYQKRPAIPSTLKKAVALKEIFDAYPKNKKFSVYRNQGIAKWQKDQLNSQNYYALHDQAPIGSVIEIYNPVTRRTVYAKVLGKIPGAAYSKNMAVMLSQPTAKLLGAKDPNFFVKIKYYK
jgi:LysM domain